VVLSAETVFTKVAATVGINALTMSGEKRKIDTHMSSFYRFYTPDGSESTGLIPKRVQVYNKSNLKKKESH